MKPRSARDAVVTLVMVVGVGGAAAVGAACASDPSPGLDQSAAATESGFVDDATATPEQPAPEPATQESATRESTPPSTATSQEAPAEKATATEVRDRDNLAPTATPPPPTAVLTVPEQSAGLGISEGIDFSFERLGTLDEALAMTWRPGTTDVFVGRQSGEVHLFVQNGDGEYELRDREVLALGDRTRSHKERGLLGLAISPDGANLYVSYTDRGDGGNRVEEFPISGTGPDTSITNESGRLIFSLDQPFANHNGGHITFGPDGHLYLGLGDGGSGGDPLNSGQDPTTLLGSIIRLHPSDPERAPDIVATGLRNPWRFSFDATSGDIWIADVGQRNFEEITWLPAGSFEAGEPPNLGWKVREGFETFANGEFGPGPIVDPISVYDHRNGRCSITGGFVYRGEAIPRLQGVYLYGDFCTGELWGLESNGSQVLEHAIDRTVGTNALASFGEDPQGELWILLHTGAVLLITPAR